MLKICVIHGYVQTANILYRTTAPLRESLKGIAEFTYVDGPSTGPGCGPDHSRPWWSLEGTEWSLLEGKDDGRWAVVVKWWSEHLSQNSYDAIIGLSQGAAMTGLLLSLLNKPQQGFAPALEQNIKFAILSSGFISTHPPHRTLYSLPSDIPTLHTVDMSDMIVKADRTIELQINWPNSKLLTHHEGHSIPVRGHLQELKDFIVQHSK
ncbi:hypothetical protein BT69DRAFT_1277919 [Atractiella rhizophila]|nr:hypothetical protein BT69DRAFT_1277919 [Atractiella rhizophila]